MRREEGRKEERRREEETREEERGGEERRGERRGEKRKGEERRASMEETLKPASVEVQNIMKSLTKSRVMISRKYTQHRERHRDLERVRK